jgi:hypothetical protein
MCAVVLSAVSSLGSSGRGARVSPEAGPRLVHRGEDRLRAGFSHGVVSATAVLIRGVAYRWLIGKP